MERKREASIARAEREFGEVVIPIREYLTSLSTEERKKYGLNGPELDMNLSTSLYFLIHEHPAGGKYLIVDP